MTTLSYHDSLRSDQQPKRTRRIDYGKSSIHVVFTGYTDIYENLYSLLHCEHYLVTITKLPGKEI